MEPVIPSLLNHLQSEVPFPYPVLKKNAIVDTPGGKKIRPQVRLRMASV